VSHSAIGTDRITRAAQQGVRISHPDRLIYPDLAISKIQLAQYYERIAEWTVPHVAARPLTVDKAILIP
jgi:DNA primase